MSCKACKEIPPISVEYTERGNYETIDGLKTYVTGPAAAARAVIVIYDVFGFASQTLQGADRLAEHMGGTLVFVPDLLEGAYARHEWVPPDTPEKQTSFQRFVGGPANIPRAAERVLRVRREVAGRYPGVEEHVAVGGLCWGGKVAVQTCGEGNEGPGRKFTVSWTAHPGALDIADTEAMNVPHICLASPDEPAAAVAEVKEILSRPGKIGHVETYGRPMFHGWMGARANLADETNAKEYERGYKQIAKFLAEYI